MTTIVKRTAIVLGVSLLVSLVGTWHIVTVAGATDVGCNTGRSDDEETVRFDGWDYPTPTTWNSDQPQYDGVTSTINSYSNYTLTGDSEYDISYSWVMLASNEPYTIGGIESTNNWAQIGPATSTWLDMLDDSVNQGGHNYKYSLGDSPEIAAQFMGPNTSAEPEDWFSNQYPSIGSSYNYSVEYNLPNPGDYEVAYEDTADEGISGEDFFDPGFSATLVQVNAETHTYADQEYGDVSAPQTFSSTEYQNASGDWIAMNQDSQVIESGLYGPSNATNDNGTGGLGYSTDSASEFSIWDWGCPISADAFTSNTDTLFTFSGVGSDDRSLSVEAGTTPSIASVGSGYVIAYEDTSGDLCTYTTSNTTYSCPSSPGSPNCPAQASFPIASGTNPSIAALSSAPNGYIVVFTYAGNDDLYQYQSPSNCGQEGSMVDDPDTSPSVAAVGSSYVIAFQGSGSNDFDTWSPSGLGYDHGLGMEADTSPSITAVGSSGAWEAAAQMNNTDLYLMWCPSLTNCTNWTNAGLGMNSATSPSICSPSSGTIEAAMQANTDDLYSVSGGSLTGSGISGTNTDQGMNGVTSPAIDANGMTYWEIAFQANTDDLYLVAGGTLGLNTNQGMDDESSPSIAP